MTASAPLTARAATTARTGSALAILAICWTVVLFDGVDTFVYGAVLPGMLADKGFGMTKAHAGTIGSIATFGMLVGALAAGIITDRIGRKKMIIACCVVFSLASAGCAMAGSPDAFGLARLAAGLGLGGLLPTAIAAVSEFAPRGRRNIYIGGLMTAHQVGGILAALLGLWLLESHGWRTIFWVGVLPLVIAVPLVAALMPESPAFLHARGRHQEAERIVAEHGLEPAADSVEQAPDQSFGAKFARLFTGRNWLVTLFMWITSFAGLLLVYGVSTWLPTMMRTQGYALGSSLNFLVIINLGGVAGMLIAGKLADHRGPVLVSALWFAATALGVYALGVHMALALTYVIVFFTGLFLFSAQTMVYAAAASAFPADSRATAVGWVSGMGRFGAVFGPWMGGQLLAGGHATSGFAAFAGFAVIALAAMLCVRLTLGHSARS